MYDDAEKSLDFNVGAMDEKRISLAKQRQEEYKELQNKGKNRRISESPEQPLNLAAYEYEAKQKAMQEERKREYNELMAIDRLVLRQDSGGPEESGLPLGQYEEKRKKLMEERKQEMKHYLM